MSPSHYRASYLVVLVLAILLILLFLGQIWRLEVTRNWITKILSPIQYGLSQGMKPLRRLSTSLREFRHLQEEVERLRGEVGRLQKELELLREVEID